MDSYSRLIAFLKVFLPLAALAILSTLFLLSRNTTPTATIPFTKEDVESRIADQQVTGPFFSGVTSTGDEILVSADRATPGLPGQPARAHDIKARIKTKDGVLINLVADEGEVEMSRDVVTFEGNVLITTTNGYQLETATLHASLSHVAGSTPGPVQGTSPMGDLSAGQMELVPQSEGGPLHLRFKNGVKLLYDPQYPE